MFHIGNVGKMFVTHLFSRKLQKHQVHCMAEESIRSHGQNVPGI